MIPLAGISHRLLRKLRVLFTRGMTLSSFWCTLKEAHDLAGDSEVGMTDHFGGCCYVEVNFVEVFDFFATVESNAVGFFLGDDFFCEFFLHFS